MNKKSLRCLTAFLTAALLMVGPQIVQANDGALSYGGTPRLMNGEGTVSMQSEVILMDIGLKEVKVDCRFVFKNHGSARTVRMGFPDGDDYFRNNSDAKLVSAFSSFQSYIDGKPVKTTLVRGRNKTDKTVLYHTKNVAFAKGQTRSVRDVYTVPVGGAMTDQSGYFATTFYILHTGSSWRGNIGRSEIIARFRRVKLTKPEQDGRKYQIVSPLASSSLSGEEFQSLKWTRPDREVVVYKGPGRPTVDRNTLRWVRTNWRPTKKDDVSLVFKSLG